MTSLRSTRFFFGHEWYTPTALQTDILRGGHYPSILVGPPGSGKTLLAQGLLQERAMTHYQQERDEVLCLLFLASNEVLVRQQALTWACFMRESFPLGYDKVECLFKTVDAHTEAHARANRQTYETLTKTSYLSELNQDEQCELLHNAWCLTQDAMSHHPYEDSFYQNNGSRNSVFLDDERECHYHKFIKILNKIHEQKVFIPGLSRLNTIEATHDFIVVDESQAEPLMVLHGILRAAKHHQVLFIGDSFQKGAQRFSSLASLAPSVQKLLGLAIETQRLDNSLRLKPEVANVAHELILLYLNLNEGKPDTHAYVSLKTDEASDTASSAQASSSGDEKSVYLLESLQYPLYQSDSASELEEAHKGQERALAMIGADANAGAIVLTQQDKSAVQQLIQGSNVFSATEARGLSFSQTLFYLSKETLHLFDGIALSMRQKGIHAETPLKARTNLPAEKRKADDSQCALLSQLIISISRTEGKLYVYIEEPDSLHKLKPFLDWFKGKLGNKARDIVIEAVQSTLDDWLRSIHRYIETDNITQALGALERQFGFSESEAKQYIAMCQSRQSFSFAENLCNWMAMQRIISPITPKPLTKAIECSQKKNTAQQQALPDVPSTFASVVFPPLSDDLKRRVEIFYNVIDMKSEDIVKKLFELNEVTQILFHHKMKNGYCLWVNLVIDGKSSFFMRGLEANIANQVIKDWKVIFERGWFIAQQDNEDLLMLCLLLNDKYRKDLFDKKWWCNHDSHKETVQSILSAILSTLPSEVQGKLLNELGSHYFSRLNPDVFTYQYQDESGYFWPSLLHLFALNFARWLLSQPLCLRLQGPWLLSRITVPGQHQGLTLLQCLIRSKEGVEYFNEHIKTMLTGLESLQKVELLIQPIAGRSFLLDLLMYDIGNTIIDKNWSDFQAIFESAPQYLFTSVKG